jgi:hypothetical protein
VPYFRTSKRQRSAAHKPPSTPVPKHGLEGYLIIYLAATKYDILLADPYST